MVKTYNVQYFKTEQYEKEKGKVYTHKKVISTLPDRFLKKIGVDEENPTINVELDEENNCIIIKKS